jgi:hypothetical protein
MMQEENGWKTEQYHCAKIMVKAQLRGQQANAGGEEASRQAGQQNSQQAGQPSDQQAGQPNNPALDGHGLAWDFLVSVGDASAVPDADTGDAQHATRSDHNIFYSTQVIAEQMGFIKGRELVEHRADPLDKQGEHGKSTL